MRVRSLAATFGAAALLVGLTSPPAAAQDPSTYCGDSYGYVQLPLVNTPVTVGIEVSYPAGGDQSLIVCYATNSTSQPGGLTGGAIRLDIDTSTSTVYPGAYVGIACHPDAGISVGPVCGLANSVDLALSDAAVSTPPSSICLVSAGSGCLAYLPGVKVVTGGDPGRALLQVVLLNSYYEVDAPAHCVAVIVTCP